MRAPDTLVAARGLSVRYPGETRHALKNIDLDIARGECIAVLGPSGSGKSTLALALTGAMPHLVPATCRGEIVWPGQRGPLSGYAGEGLAATVLQDTDAQLVALTVEDEIAFALENRDMPGAEIDIRIARALERPPGLGLHRRDLTLALSGGWRQRLALAAALAEQPALLVIDEPTAHLDEGAAASAMTAIEVAGGDGTAALLVEHRADLACRIADRIIVLDGEGQLQAAGGTDAILRRLATSAHDPGIRLPAEIRAYSALLRSGYITPDQPFSMVDAADRVVAICAGNIAARALALSALGLDGVIGQGTAGSKPMIRLEAVTLSRGGRDVLVDMNFELYGGECVGIAGPNGAGKTTLLLAAARALRPDGGRIDDHGGGAVLVPQNPTLTFAAPSLRTEAERRRLPWAKVREALEAFGIAANGDRHPLHHSQGELRRIALALAFADERPRSVLLDEPTAGLDQRGLEQLRLDIHRLVRRGCGVAVVSHDLDFLGSVATRLVLLERGKNVIAGETATVLRQAAEGRAPVAPPPAAALALRLGWGTSDA